MENKLVLPVDHPRPPKKKYLEAKKAETQLRLNQVVEWLRKGYSRRKCIDEIIKKWNFSETQARKYVHDAFIMIYEASKVASNDELREQYIDRMEELLSDALSRGKFEVATRLMDMLNKISGMYTEKQEVDVTVNDMKFKFGDE
jgi:polyhydroxyalkanoate synthesis regulator phasin